MGDGEKGAQLETPAIHFSADKGDETSTVVGRQVSSERVGLDRDLIKMKINKPFISFVTYP